MTRQIQGHGDIFVGRSRGIILLVACDPTLYDEIDWKLPSTLHGSEQEAPQGGSTLGLTAFVQRMVECLINSSQIVN